jgi:hypothetical protein
VNCRLADGALEALVSSSHSALLEELILRTGNFTDRGARLLAESPHLKNLRALVLDSAQTGPAGPRR